MIFQLIECFQEPVFGRYLYADHFIFDVLLQASFKGRIRHLPDLPAARYKVAMAFLAAQASSPAR